jgi:hypothetical protein
MMHRPTPPIILIPLSLTERAAMVAEALADAQLAAKHGDRKAEAAFIVRVAELIGARHATTLPDLLRAGRDFVQAIIPSNKPRGPYNV